MRYPKRKKKRERESACVCVYDGPAGRRTVGRRTEIGEERQRKQDLLTHRIAPHFLLPLLLPKNRKGRINLIVLVLPGSVLPTSIIRKVRLSV